MSDSDDNDNGILGTKVGKGTVGTVLVLMGAIGAGAPLTLNTSTNNDQLDGISEKVIENKETIAVMEARVEDHTATLGKIQGGVSDNSEKLNQIIGQLRRQEYDDKL